ncbi:hypothetical protein ES703_37286 [subsurface metagenome]
MSRIVTLVCVLLLVGYCLVSSGQAEPERAAIARKPRYSWRQTDSSLALLNHGRIVWQLNFNKKEGKPYFHPVGLIDGTVLTWLRPADHHWHRALWFSWKYINGLNYWEEDPETGLSEGRTEIVSINVTPHDDYSTRVAMKLSYHPPDKPTVLTERRLIRVSGPDEQGRYRIDWRSTFTAGKKDVLLDRTPIPGEKGGKGFGGYAGLSVRMAKTTRGWEFVDSEGRKDKEAHGKRDRWVDFSGELADGKEAGISMFDYPENLRHPTPWYVEKGMPYFSPAVLFDKAYTLAAGKSLTLRYRILIRPGRADKALLEGEWKAFLKTTDIEVRMESANKLLALGMAMVTYSGDYEVKFPDDMRALHKYGNLKKKDLEWLLENVVYLGKGRTDSTIRPNTVLAYDKTLLAKGKGTNVLFGDLRVAFRTPEQLKKLGIKPSRKTNVEVEVEKKGTTDVLPADYDVQVEGEPTVSKLLTALQKNEKYVHIREPIIQMVEEIGDKEPISFLVEQLQSENRRRRCDAALALELLGDRRGVPAIIKELEDTAYRPIQDTSIRSDSPENLKRKFEKRQIRQDRYYSALLLGILGDERAVPALIEATWDETINYQAAMSLGQIGDKSAVPALRAMLERLNKPFPRLFAGYGLAMLSDEEGLKVVIDTLNNREQQWVIRRHAIEALGKLGDKQAVPHLIVVLKDDHPNIRVSAARALGAIGDASALPALEKALRDK